MGSVAEDVRSNNVFPMKGKSVAEERKVLSNAEHFSNNGDTMMKR